MPHDFQADITAVQNIGAVPTILDVVCRATGMGFAAVARVTEQRWVTCSVLDNIHFGLKPGDELKVETTLCHEIRQSHEAIVIDEVATDKIYCKHLTPAHYGFQSYISMPIFLPDGSFFGTLCAIDPKPAKLKNSQVIGTFKLFAELIAFHIDAQRKLDLSEASLFDARTAAELREQFIAVLGHDLRNPLASISAGARLLQKTPLDDKAKNILAMMHTSVQRMASLINNVLDFARGRLGGGILLSREANAPLETALKHVVEELRSGYPGRAVDATFALTQPVNCDAERMGQVLSNLLGNALTHGSGEAPVRVEAMTRDGEFTMSVTNAGSPIPELATQQLFQPFVRGASGKGGLKQGLGLGLYIAMELMRAHGGTIDVQSSAVETRFTARLPLT